MLHPLRPLNVRAGLLALSAVLALMPVASAQTSNLVAQPGSPAPINIDRDPQVKDELFAGTEQFAKGAKEVTEVNMDPSMLGAVGGGSARSGLAHKLNFMVVRTYAYDKPGMYRMEDVETYRKRLMDGSWNCFIHTRSKDESTDICKRQLADHETNEMVIMTVEPRELTFIHMSGRMSLADLQKFNGGSLGGNPGGDAGALQKHDQ